MSRRCERPDCATAATIAYGFDASARTAWFADLDTGTHGRVSTATAGALCRRHAAAMVLPRGWWLDDRRSEAEALLFAPSDLDQSVGAADEVTRRRRKRSSLPPRDTTLTSELVTQPDLGFDESAAVGEPVVSPLEGDGVGADAAPIGEPLSVPPSDQMSVPVSEPAPWMPAFDHADDLDGLLDARSPLLARAFQGRRRSTGPAR